MSTSHEEERVHPVQATAMNSFCVAALRKVGLSRADAELLSDTLVQADLRGVHSHGVARFPRYVKGYQAGGVNPHPSFKVVKDSEATAVVDGDDGLGLVVGAPAMNLAMDKAARYGVSAVTMRNSNHLGMMAYWSMMALPRDMIGFVTTNGTPTLAPWGGITPSYSNNPVSYAIPAEKELPLVLDMAMSVAAKGKIRIAALKGKPIPPGWAADRNGEPTTDAKAAMTGLLLPIAGYKGYGLAMVNDVLCGVLSGGSSATDIPEVHPEHVIKAGYCHFFQAIDIAHFMPVSAFKERVDRLIGIMKSSKLARGQERICVPGEIEFELHRQRSRDGIPYPEEIVAELGKLARALDLRMDF